MPTGYTCKIEDGSITNGKDFIKLCLNNFGIMMHNRDNTPTLESQDYSKVFASEIEYYTKSIERTKQELKELEEEIENNYDAYKERVRKEIMERLKSKKEYLEEQKTLDTLYLRIKSEVEDWDCSEDFNNIKEFCLNQIEISRPENYFKYTIEDIKSCEETLSNFDEFFKDYQIKEIERLTEQIYYCEDKISDVNNRIVSRQEFYDRLMEEISYL